LVNNNIIKYCYNMNADIVTLYLTNSNFMTMHYDAF